MQIPIEELPDTLQAMLKKASENNMPMTITQAGQPVATITPAPQPKSRPPFGFMKGTGDVVGDVVSPVEQS